MQLPRECRDVTLERRRLDGLFPLPRLDADLMRFTQTSNFTVLAFSQHSEVVYEKQSQIVGSAVNFEVDLSIKQLNLSVKEEMFLDLPQRADNAVRYLLRHTI